jgi:hypothetical protein
MKKMTRADRDAGGTVSPGIDDVPEDVSEGSAHRPAEAGPQQASLPFDRQPVVPLPFDDETDRPIGFGLTARARRAVAPATLPDLSLVAGATEEDPADTRPARARALRRAGADTADIARQLRVDELLVRAWTDDVAARPAAGRGSAAARAAAVLAAPAGTRDPEPAQRLVDEQLRTVRQEALADGRRRLATDADFAAGVGLMAGIVTLDRHAICFQTDRPEVAARAGRWLTQRAGADPRDVRVVLRLGSAVAGDLARHEWATVLGIAPEQIAFTRWRHAVDDHAVEALVRITDPDAAARVAGWCEALLQPELDPADVAF